MPKTPGGGSKPPGVKKTLKALNRVIRVTRNMDKPKRPPGSRRKK